MSETQRWLHLQMKGELESRRNSLLARRSELQRAAAEILSIDEMVERIDVELKERTAALAALPAPVEEKADAQPT